MSTQETFPYENFSNPKRTLRYEIAIDKAWDLMQKNKKNNRGENEELDLQPYNKAVKKLRSLLLRDPSNEASKKAAERGQRLVDSGQITPESIQMLIGLV